jgi:hypothetical protein
MVRQKKAKSPVGSRSSGEIKHSRRKFLKMAAAALVAGSILPGCDPPKPRSKAAMEAFRKKKYAAWKKTPSGKNCIRLTDRAAHTIGKSDAYVLDRVRVLDPSKQGYLKLRRAYDRANNALPKHLSTEADKRLYARLRAKMDRIEDDCAIVRTMIDADIVCAGLGASPDGTLPQSGSALKAAVMGHKSFTVKSHGRFDNEIEQRLDPAHLPKGRSKERASARQPRWSRPVPEPLSLPSGHKWPEILKIYAGWQRALNHPKRTEVARSAVRLVEDIAFATDTRPLDVLAVKASYSVNKYVSPIFKGISPKEKEIFNKLLAASTKDKKAFDFLHSTTTSQHWRPGTKARLLKLAGEEKEPAKKRGRDNKVMYN